MIYCDKPAVYYVPGTGIKLCEEHAAYKDKIEPHGLLIRDNSMFDEGWKCVVCKDEEPQEEPE